MDMCSTMNLPAPPTLTQVARDRLDAARAADRPFREGIAESLGAQKLEYGKGAYVLPAEHDGTTLLDGGTDGAAGVIQTCSRCQRGVHHPRECAIASEAMVWNTARRRGETFHFAPVLGQNIDAGWQVMQKATPLGEYLSDCLQPFGPDGNDIDPMAFRRAVKAALRRRDWYPEDVEVMAIDGRPVVIDYEKMYHESFFSPLHFHSFRWFGKQNGNGDKSYYSERTWEVLEREYIDYGAPTATSREAKRRHRRIQRR
jgi:hypothetical protein